MRQPATQDVLEAVGRLAREKRAALAGLARREGLGAEDAVDCVHDALCGFLEMAQRGEVAASPSEQASFLAGMVVNVARNRRRRHTVARVHKTQDALEKDDDRPTTEALLAHAEDCVRLRGCVARLCEKQRTVVMRRLLEERPGEDVASALGLTRGHVDVLLHRAKASLRVCMLEARVTE
jgi:RNA polymerase sigma-70 factor (ECF subfamily)